MNPMNDIPKTGYCRLSQIIGDKNARPTPIPALVPVSKTTWYKGIQAGIYPKPTHAGRCALWRWADIRSLLVAMEKGESDQ
ncbi:AlpA family transcriptional regulator [Methylococcus sp. EFPC2]|uniref:helix-turn-helix transcriptional regulator n=1 Tax=Methylococcus sp. EFPC2 TaxID=2812648 RepID=UPI00196727AF|nr:AlpA family transcriptional regulator [Methylococcus sp. EFPC2]QSA97501.1 AlpA family transcriptional regulator [Methylococcus sp. EFPC2]